MPGPFEGMGSILTGVLGAPVRYLPQGGVESTRHWHVRVYPDDAFGGERPLQMATAELRAPRGEALDIADGDQIVTAAGRVFRIGKRIETSNPASDALVPFELRDVTP